MTKPKTDLERIQEAAEIGGITMATTYVVDSLEEPIQTILNAIGYPNAWVSDESMIGDFFSTNEQGVRVVESSNMTIEQLGQKLNLHDLKTSDYIVDVAKLLLTKKSN